MFRARRGMARCGMAWQGKAWHGSLGRGRAHGVMFDQGRAGHNAAWWGWVWPGPARLGRVRQGREQLLELSRHGKVGLGQVWYG